MLKVLHHQQQQSQLQIEALQQERARLLQKNELAQAKVEAIIQHLNVLGGAEDPHIDDIYQIAQLKQEDV